jgi:hypothetical protein
MRLEMRLYGHPDQLVHGATFRSRLKAQPVVDSLVQSNRKLLRSHSDIMISRNHDPVKSGLTVRHSTHLKVLERAGLIARGRSAQWRPCRLDAGPMREAAEWLAGYRRFWDQSFDRLDDYLSGLNAKEQP